MDFLNFIDTHPFYTGLIMGTVLLSYRLLRRISINIFRKTLGGEYLYSIFSKILKQNHTLVLYSQASNGTEGIYEDDMFAPKKPVIKDPLRLEDDEDLNKLATPHLYYDPLTLKIKGYFHLLTPKRRSNKYYKTVYEGYLVFKKHVKNDSNSEGAH